MMYGQNYGYRSGLNQSMVDHLHNKVKRILELITLNQDDIAIDIGSNDSTLLQAYPEKKCKLVGFDPTGKKFEKSQVKQKSYGQRKNKKNGRPSDRADGSVVSS